MTPISEVHPLILGSASPRRRDLLQGLGIPLRILPAAIDEQQHDGEAAEAYVRRMAVEKAQAVVEQAGPDVDAAAVLAADTIVVLDDDVLGKPADEQQAFELVSRLAGCVHRVLTAYRIVLVAGAQGVVAERVVESRVWLRAAGVDELRRYAATGEGLDKAGAYAVQGLGAFLVERLEGSYSNVVGLPACEVVVDLKRAGLLGAFP